MEIELVWGSGEGNTELSAFDKALSEGGIHNYNLVTLSSVIPDGASVALSGTHNQQWHVGEMVGVVLSENESRIEGETIAAGLGWATAAEGGVFFEASGETATNVENMVKRGVETAMETRDSWQWDSGIKTKVVEHTVEHTGAVIVSAIYRPLSLK